MNVCNAKITCNVVLKVVSIPRKSMYYFLVFTFGYITSQHDRDGQNHDAKLAYRDSQGDIQQRQRCMSSVQKRLTGRVLRRG
jgi:hypothetical protein